MFPPFPPDYPYGYPQNPYATGNAVNPLSVFAVSNPILQAIRAGAGALAPKPPQQAAKPPGGGTPPPAGAPSPAPGVPPTPLPTAPPTTLGGWPGITPTPVPSPIGTTLDQPPTAPIESVTSTFDPTAGGGYWSSDPTTGQPVWNAPNTTGYIDTTGGYLDLGGGSYGPDTSGWDTSIVDSGMTP